MDTRRKKGGIEGEGKEEGGKNIMTTVVVGYTTLKRVCSYFHLWWAAVSMQMRRLLPCRGLRMQIKQEQHMFRFKYA